MERLHWELSVLSRAVAYKNLSGASSHVGLSQPQLSRIVSKIEKELNVVILDRGVRRKSNWTPTAYQLAELYLNLNRKFNSEIQNLVVGMEPKFLRVGALEGLIPLASEFCHHLLTKTSVQVLEMDIYDLNPIEEYFFKGDLDMIFTLREPGKGKFSHVRVLGYQSLDETGKESDIRVMSSFEYGTQMNKLKLGKTKAFVSNSLEVRKNWLSRHGGVGVLPSNIGRKKPSSKNIVTVSLIGQDYLSPAIWEQALKVDFQ